MSAQNGYQGAVRPKARAARRRTRELVDAISIAFKALERELRAVDALIKKHPPEA